MRKEANTDSLFNQSQLMPDFSLIGLNVFPYWKAMSPDGKNIGIVMTEKEVSKALYPAEMEIALESRWAMLEGGKYYYIKPSENYWDKSLNNMNKAAAKRKKMTYDGEAIIKYNKIEKLWEVQKMKEARLFDKLKWKLQNTLR